MSAAFLSADEVRELTGYKLAAKQIEWLIRNAIPHYVNALGRPVVPKNLLAERSVAHPELGTVK
jgi:hypothetical protein